METPNYAIEEVQPAITKGQGQKVAICFQSFFSPYTRGNDYEIKKTNLMDTTNQQIWFILDLSIDHGQSIQLKNL